MSLRGRLLLAVVAVGLTGLVVADVATYLALRSYLMGQTETRLAEAVATVAHAVPADGEIDRDDLRDAAHGGLLAPGMYVERRGSGGDSMVIGGRSHIRPVLPDPLPQPPTPTGHVDLLTANVAGGADLLVRVQPSGTQGGVLIVATSLGGVEDVLDRLLIVEVAVAVTVVVIIAFAGSMLVQVGLRPLDEIGRTAAGIATGDLTSRVLFTDGRTEVGRLGQSLNEMLQRIEQAFAEREASERALQCSEERLRRFVADASHELRTPLAAVAAYAELLDRAVQDHPEDLCRLASRIRSESGRMGVLVADLLLLSRLDQGRPLDRQVVDLGLVAEEAVEATRAVDPDRRVVLRVGGLVEVTGDRDRLRQVVDNLISNAREHTPSGTPVEVEVEASDVGGEGTAQARLRVVDHGTGIDAGERERIFERFYRVEASRHRAGARCVDSADRVTGTGLGLAIVRAIVDAHDGAVSVTPTEGGGSTFTVELALAEGCSGGPPIDDDQAEVPVPPDPLVAT
jgi:two-component system, OmpR family, sensor kinase